MTPNPPAFPREDYQCDDAPGQRGMSMRNYFAAHAPPPPDAFTIPSPECDNWDDNDKGNRAWSDWSLRRAVAWANAYADAMIADAAKAQP